DPVDLDLGGLPIEEVVPLLLGELLDRLVGVEVAAAAEDPAVPPLHAVAGNGEGALVERLRLIEECGQVEVADRAHALAPRTHPADAVERDLLGALPVLGALVDRDRTSGADRGDVE